MIVPNYWAEARAQSRRGGKQVTVRRFGWSETSEAEAQAMADARAAEALQKILAGGKAGRREPKVAYNGADGVPIREEVVARHGDAVVTRNGYGARCLNTPDIVFADVDYRKTSGLGLKLGVFGGLLVLAVLAGFVFGSRPAGIALAVAAAVVSAPLGDVVHRARLAATGGSEGSVRARLAEFLRQHPEWGVRVYRTPAGLRLIATHALLEPHDPVVRAFFEAVGVDPIYARMCSNQRCFRARLTAKPWRIGIGSHLKPRPGVWPVRPERRAERDAWIADYEAKARGHAACAFVDVLGSGATHPKVAEVVDLHDAACRAREPGLPLA